MDQHQIERFRKILAALVVYTLIVILWGAWVRISHSGDGCGDTWPLCQGQLIPAALQKKTWVEYGHRLMSGLYGLFVLGLFLWGRKVFMDNHWARKAGLATLIFMIIEALLGAKLVLFGLVMNNSSVFRAVAMGLHQINSLLLMGATVVWYQFSRPNDQMETFVVNTQLKKNKTFVWNSVFSGIIVCFLALAVAGAWASLSTTLFPSESLWEGLSKDFAPDSHFILKLRLAHPLLGLSVGFGISYYFFNLAQKWRRNPLRNWALINGWAFGLGVIFGILTLLFLSPVWMKICHLAIAHILWITLVSYAVISADSTRRYKN